MTEKPPLSKEESIKMLRTRQISAWNDKRIAVQQWNPDLRKADLHGINLEREDLTPDNIQDIQPGGADLNGAALQEADFRNSNLSYVYFKGALLRQADFRGATFYRTNFTGARLPQANFKGATLIYVDFSGADVSGVEYDKKTKCVGIRVDSCFGSEMFKRFAQDQAFIEELQTKNWWGKPLYNLWNIFADCGRTPWRWLGWSIVFAVYFGLIYFFMGTDGLEITSKLPQTFSTYLYYSVVTFTTLGFGDVVPKTSSAAWWVMAEVILGYIMLGGLISILATKLARRS